MKWKIMLWFLTRRKKEIHSKELEKNKSYKKNIKKKAPIRNYFMLACVTTHAVNI